MAAFVGQVIHPQLLTVRGHTPADEALHAMEFLGVGAVAVIDSAGFPAGMLMLRDLHGSIGLKAAADVMRTPPPVVDRGALIEDAAMLMSNTDSEWLIVVDGAGRVAGMLSSLDLTRCLAGLPPRRTTSLLPPDWPSTGAWSSAGNLDPEAIRLKAPTGPGVFVVLHGGPCLPDMVIWAEESPDVRDRLLELVRSPLSYPVSRWCDAGRLSFRAASVTDPGRRAPALSMLMEM